MIYKTNDHNCQKRGAMGYHNNNSNYPKTLFKSKVNNTNTALVKIHLKAHTRHLNQSINQQKLKLSN